MSHRHVETMNSVVYVLMLIAARTTFGDAANFSYVSANCDNMATTTYVESNTTYVLTNCTRDAQSVFVFFTVTEAIFGNGSVSAATLQNIAIVVRGGNVWPQFNVSNINGTASWQKNFALRNISVEVRDVVADSSPQIFFSSDTPFISLLSLQSSGPAKITMSNISIVVENTAALFLMNATKEPLAATYVVPFLHFQGSSGNLFFVDSIHIRVTKSNVSCSLVGNGTATVAAFVAIVAVQNSSISNFNMTVDHSNLTLVVNSSAALRNYAGVSPSVCYLSVNDNNASTGSTLTNASFTTTHAVVSVRLLFPRSTTNNDIANDVVTIATFSNFATFYNIAVTLRDACAFITAACGSGCISTNTVTPHTRFFEISANTEYSRVVNLSIASERAQVTSQAAYSAQVFSVKESAVAENLIVNIAYCSFSIRSENITLSSLQKSGRTLAVLSMSADTLSQVQVVFRALNASFIADVAAPLVATTILDLPTRSIIITVELSGIMMDMVFTGTCSSVVIKTTSVVSMIPPLQKDVEFREQIDINVTNCSLRLRNDASFPPLIQSIPTALVVAITAVINIVRSLAGSSVVLDGVAVLREYVPPDTAILLEVTCMINLLDANSLLAALSLALTAQNFLPPISNLITISTPIGNITQETTLFRVAHSSLLFSPTLPIAPSFTYDIILFFTLPRYAIQCDISLSDLNHRVELLMNPLGAPLGGLSVADVINTSIMILRANVTMLLFAALANVTFRGELQNFTVVNCTVVSRFNGQNLQKYLIGALSPNFVIVDMSLLQHPLWNIRLCTFTGFDMVVEDRSVLLRHVDVMSRLVKVVKFGCNLWEGHSMPPRVINFAPVTYVSYPSSYYNDSVFCSGFPTASKTSIQESSAEPTATVSLQQWEMDTSSPSELILQTSLTSVIAIAGILSAAFGAQFDAQSLVALGQMACAPQQLRDATQASQFLLSPFYSFGSLGTVLGNIGIFLVLHGLHRSLLWNARRVTSAQMSQSTANMFTSSAHNNNYVSKLATPTVQMIPPEVAAKYPNHSILAATLLLPGVVHGGTQGLFSGGDVAGTIAGVIALIVVGAFVWWRVRVAGRSRVVLKMRFVPYKTAVLRKFIAPWALPVGLWCPDNSRATVGRLRGGVRGGSEWLSAHTLCCGLIIQFVASISVPQSWCTGLWFVLVGLYVAFCVIVSYFHPGRAPFADVLIVFGYLMTALVALFAELETLRDDSSSLVTALLAASLASAAISLCKTIHAVVLFVWEQRQQKQHDGLMTTHNNTVTKASSFLVIQGAPRHGGSHLFLPSRSSTSVERKHRRVLTVALSQNEALRSLVEMACEFSNNV